MVLANILGPDALIIVVLAVVLLFGAGQLPKFARSVGEASKEFKRIQDDSRDGNPSATAPPLALSSSPAGSAGGPEETVQMSGTQLDALLNEHQAGAQKRAEQQKA